MNFSKLHWKLFYLDSGYADGTEKFTALDIIFGYRIVGILLRREDFLHDFPEIKAYGQKIRERPTFARFLKGE